MNVSLDQNITQEISLINMMDHHDPHHLLGLHPLSPDQKVIRVWRPGASEIFIELQGERRALNRVDNQGLFELIVPKITQLLDYKVFHQSGLLAYDPYAFSPTFGEMDQYLFSRGVHYQLYQVLGGRIGEHQGVKGARFTVWAPSAKSVSLVGDFNHWNGRVNPMRSLGFSGVWELFVPGLEEGVKYKFEIKTQTGQLLLKSDPMAVSSELRPRTASVLAKVNNFVWDDFAWLEQREENAGKATPLNIYEVHLGSWKRKDGEFYNYRELAPLLASYCVEMGYTHVELLPITEHPLDESWGYQVTGFYAVTSRFGSPSDFQFFVNHLHKKGIGVIIDWVPGHFPNDSHGLARFDGTALYEHEDPRQGWHPHWQTNIFNFQRTEVSNFLLANALFWLDEMHVDGLRVDAVASILYLDYGRNEGEWIPNQYGGKENLAAIEFFKHLNSILHKKFPGAVTIAEESTSFAKVSHPVSEGGLGFDYKWNMGWMNDTLRYISKDSFYRHHHHQDLTFGLLYAFSERFILVFSHGEVVHGKGSLMGKMPGDYWQQFANMRLLLSYMMCQPGKKLLFMGGEIGQWNEWHCKRELEWDILRYPVHSDLHKMVQQLNRFYLNHRELWAFDFDFRGFEWVDFSDSTNSIISYLRKSEDKQLFCVHNFTPTYFPHYFFPLKNVKALREVFNTDAVEYGGSGKVREEVRISINEQGQRVGVELKLAPLATQIFEIEWQ